MIKVDSNSVVTGGGHSLPALFPILNLFLIKIKDIERRRVRRMVRVRIKKDVLKTVTSLFSPSKIQIWTPA